MYVSLAGLSMESLPHPGRVPVLAYKQSGIAASGVGEPV